MGRKTLKSKIAISVLSAILLIGHLIWPAVKLDVASIFLLAVILLPWLGTIFKTVEIPGGPKVEYRDEELLKATQKLEDVGLLQESSGQRGDPIYLELIGRDTNLALAGLRIDIERRLRKIANYLEPIDPPSNLRQVVSLIGSRGLFTKIQTEAMHGILNSLNHAVHGGRIPADDAEEIMEKGLRLLGSLDKRILNQKQASEVDA